MSISFNRNGVFLIYLPQDWRGRRAALPFQAYLHGILGRYKIEALLSAFCSAYRLSIAESRSWKSLLKYLQLHRHCQSNCAVYHGKALADLYKWRIVRSLCKSLRSWDHLHPVQSIFLWGTRRNSRVSSDVHRLSDRPLLNLSSQSFAALHQNHFHRQLRSFYSSSLGQTLFLHSSPSQLYSQPFHCLHHHLQALPGLIWQIGVFAPPA